jgi:hypothetical protein
MARVQAFTTPVWRRVAAGCHLDRDTEHVLRAAGLEIVDVWRSRGGRGSLIQGIAVPAGR